VVAATSVTNSASNGRPPGKRASSRSRASAKTSASTWRVSVAGAVVERLPRPIGVVLNRSLEG
jgi:hypothetical protein